MSAPFFSESYASTPAELRQETREFNVIFVHSLLDDYGLPASAFRVYCHLARRAGRGSAWPAVAQIARVCRLHPQSVRKALRLLVAHNLLQREERPGNTTLYRLTPPSAWQPPIRIDGNPSETNTPLSHSEGSPAKIIQGQPYETDIGKGNPSEGNPKKEKQIHVTRQLPSSEDEAIKEALSLEIPAAFARQEFNRMVSVGWLDGCQRSVRSWPHYLKQRWDNEQRQRGGRHAPGPATAKRSQPPPRQFDSGDYHQPVKDF